MHEELLRQLGLTDHEIRVYLLLFDMGKSKARDLVTPSGLGRANLYHVLASLVARGLVVILEGKQQEYQVTHPERLLSLVEERRLMVERLAQETRSALPTFISRMHLSTGKPVLRYFEGIAGLEEAIEDSLLAKNGICTFLDVTAFTGAIAEANARYVKKRIARGVHKRILVADSEEARAFFGPTLMPHTEVRFLSQFPQGLHAALEIYNDTVAFFTLSPRHHIAALMTDQALADFQRAQFLYLWDRATPL